MADRDFYSIEPDTMPARVLIGGANMAVDELPPDTQVFISEMIDQLRRLHAENPLGFEVAFAFVAARKHWQEMDQQDAERCTECGHLPGPLFASFNGCKCWCHSAAGDLG